MISEFRSADIGRVIACIIAFAIATHSFFEYRNVERELRVLETRGLSKRMPVQADRASDRFDRYRKELTLSELRRLEEKRQFNLVKGAFALLGLILITMGRSVLKGMFP